MILLVTHRKTSSYHLKNTQILRSKAPFKTPEEGNISEKAATAPADPPPLVLDCFNILLFSMSAADEGFSSKGSKSCVAVLGCKNDSQVRSAVEQSDANSALGERKPCGQKTGSESTVWLHASFYRGNFELSSATLCTRGEARCLWRSTRILFGYYSAKQMLALESTLDLYEIIFLSWKG